MDIETLYRITNVASSEEGNPLFTATEVEEARRLLHTLPSDEPACPTRPWKPARPWRGRYRGCRY